MGGMAGLTGKGTLLINKWELEFITLNTARSGGLQGGGDACMGPSWKARYKWKKRKPFQQHQ